MDRPFIEFLKSLNRKFVGVEIGVYRGENALSMLKELDIEKLYLIDPYLLYTGYKHGGFLIREQKDLDGCCNLMLERIKPYKDKVVLIKEKSEDAINKIPELDFVYIDGNHDYEYVKRDIELYYPKVKKGGIIGGDNMEQNTVYKAVIEFLQKEGLMLLIKEWKLAVEWWSVK